MIRGSFRHAFAVAIAAIAAVSLVPACRSRPTPDSDASTPVAIADAGSPVPVAERGADARDCGSPPWVEPPHGGPSWQDNPTCNDIARSWATVPREDRACATDSDCVIVGEMCECQPLNRTAAAKERYRRLHCRSPAEGACRPCALSVALACRDGCCTTSPVDHRDAGRRASAPTPVPPATTSASSSLGQLGGFARSDIDAKIDKAIASMRGCKADPDCVLVTVVCGQAAVAKASAATAESAMRSACPPAGASGGPGPNVPKVRCAAARCEIAP